MYIDTSTYVMSASDTKHIIIFTHMLKMMDLDLLREAFFASSCCLVSTYQTLHRSHRPSQGQTNPG